MLPQEPQRHVARGDELVLGDLQTEGPAEPLHIILAAAGGVVGDIIGPASDRVDVRQKLGAALIEGIPQGQGAVYVEEEEFFAS